MSQAKIVREELKEADTVFSGVLIELKNACIVFLSEGEEALGTLAISVPQKPGMVGPQLSSLLLGERNATLARLLAERLAKSLAKMALVSVFVRTLNEERAGQILLKLLEKVLRKQGGARP